jgi:hypothetical protein
MESAWSLRYAKCSRNGSIERDGKWYCKTHDPLAIEEKRKKREIKYEIESKKLLKEFYLRRAAPDLLEAIETIKKSLADLRNARKEHLKIGIDMLIGVSDEAIKKAKGKA